MVEYKATVGRHRVGRERKGDLVTKDATPGSDQARSKRHPLVIVVGIGNSRGFLEPRWMKLGTCNGKGLQRVEECRIDNKREDFMGWIFLWTDDVLQRLSLAVPYADRLSRYIPSTL